MQKATILFVNLKVLFATWAWAGPAWVLNRFGFHQFRLGLGGWGGGLVGTRGAKVQVPGLPAPIWSLGPGHLGHIHTTENKRLSLNHTSHAEL